MRTHSIAICSLAVLGVACGDATFYDSSSVMASVERAKFGLGEGTVVNPNAVDTPDEIDPNSLPRCDEIAQWSANSAREEDDFLPLINAFRAQGAMCGDQNMPPAPPLVRDEALSCAARWHARDMAERKYFAHDSPDGANASDRLDAAGYAWRTWGENIAKGNEEAVGTMQQWIDSPPHCMNMMNPRFTQLGVGYYAKEDPKPWRGRLWALDLGKPR